jgi:uncharacterized protein
MALEKKYDGFAPGTFTIDGIGAGGFMFGGMSHRGSLLCLPDGVRAIEAGNFADVEEAMLAPLFDLPRGSVDLMLFGCGKSLQPIPPDLRQKLRAHGVGCDPMSTSAACQTYNILLGERRPVGALLIATD